MARTYRRDARGRFTSGGGSGQTGGRGARLKGGGAKRAGGGAKMTVAKAGGTVAKPSRPPSANKPSAPKPANKIAPSPRRPNAAERAYMEIKNGKGKSKFRSDKKVLEEMQRRGFLKGKDPQGQLINIASQARRKKAGGGSNTNYW